MKPPNYNPIAGIYDYLARFIFGESLKKAKHCHIIEMLTCKQILIVGGGSGSELLELEREGFTGKITFVEPSDMIEKAKSRNLKIDVEFVKKNWPFGETKKYDGVITPFFLDQFSGNELQRIMETLVNSLARDGLWLNTDFIPPETRFQKVLLNIMYRFFRVVAGLKNNKLENFDVVFEKAGFFLVSEVIYNQWVKSTVWKRV